MAKQQKSIGFKKILSWIIVIAVFYVLTTATKSTGIVEVEKTLEQPRQTQEPYIVEKLVKTTKYKTEKVPFGEPRCEQMNYNFSQEKEYSESFSGNSKTVTCTFFITNLEDIAGTFTFYPQLFKNDKVSEGGDLTKTLEPFATQRFEWNFTVDATDSTHCLIQIESPPHRMKCFYLAPITYQIKEIPYTVEELKNVTEYTIRTETREVTFKENVTQNIYTNRFFGYKQFFYFGY
jgi:hypothetical protein